MGILVGEHRMGHDMDRRGHKAHVTEQDAEQHEDTSGSRQERRMTT
jgi:hypothetical protein